MGILKTGTTRACIEAHLDIAASLERAAGRVTSSVLRAMLKRQAERARDDVRCLRRQPSGGQSADWASLFTVRVTGTDAQPRIKLYEGTPGSSSAQVTVLFVHSDVPVIRVLERQLSTIRSRYALIA